MIRKTANIEFNLNLQQLFSIGVNDSPEEVLENITNIKIDSDDIEKNYYSDVYWKITDTYITHTLTIYSNWKVSNILEEIMISN